MDKIEKFEDTIMNITEKIILLLNLFILMAARATFSCHSSMRMMVGKINV